MEVRNLQHNLLLVDVHAETEALISNRRSSRFEVKVAVSFSSP